LPSHSQVFASRSSDGASGVLATEIPVFEQLAGEFGKIFVKEFLAGARPGRRSWRRGGICSPNRTHSA